jgi:hypothetical protein
MTYRSNWRLTPVIAIAILGLCAACSSNAHSPASSTNSATNATSQTNVAASSAASTPALAPSASDDPAAAAFCRDLQTLSAADTDDLSKLVPIYEKLVADAPAAIKSDAAAVLAYLRAHPESISATAAPTALRAQSSALGAYTLAHCAGSVH